MIQSITATNWISLSSKYPYDNNLNLIGEYIPWSDGYSTIKYNLFNYAKDLSINKNTAFYLTTTYTLFDILNEKNNGNANLGTYLSLQIGNEYVTVFNNSLYLSATEINDYSFFRLVSNIDGTISFLHGNQKYITVNKYLPYNLTLEDQLFDLDSQRQKFNYIIKNNKIYITTKFDTTILGETYVVERFWSYDPVSKKLRAIGIITDDDYILENKYLFDTTGFDLLYNIDGLKRDQTYVRYFNKLENKLYTYNTIIDETQSLTAIPNRLVDSPYNSKINLSAKMMDINFANLKSIETPEYQYEYKNDGEYVINLRNYEKIFSGTNQENGYETPFLGFTGETTLQTFKTDGTTYFHYPSTADQLPLSSSNLINCGAIAGTIPYKSDKIWKYMGNYSQYSYKGNALPEFKQNGIWLCSWLSGNNDLSQTPIWKDRWYNPGYMNETGAYFANSGTHITDIDSELTFDKGAYYKYFHIGNLFNTTLVNLLTTNSGLHLHIDDWEYPITYDKSPYNNEIGFKNINQNNILNYSINKQQTDTCLSLTGNQYCEVLYTSALNLKDKFSLSMWAYADNWTNFNGSMIYEKGFRGGYNLKYNNGFYNPILSLISDNGRFVILNTEGLVINNGQLPASSNPISVFVDKNLFTWILDDGIYNGSKHLYKIDYNGNILNNYAITSADKCLAFNTDVNNVHRILTWTNNVSTDYKISYIDTNCTLLTSITGATYYTNIDVDLSGNNILSVSNYSIIDNENVYKSLSNCIDMNCDQYNNIWTIKTSNDFYKNNDLGLVLSGTLTTTTSTSERYVNFTNELYNGTYKNFVWFIQTDEKKIYKYDENGSLIRTINLKDYDVSPKGNGDFTGYQWNRKYNYLQLNDQKPVIQTNITLGTNLESVSGSYSLSYPISALTNRGWHMFTVTYDNVNGLYNFYVDTILRDTCNTPISAKVYFEYENSLYLGTNSGRTKPLSIEINDDVEYFKGKIDDVRLYDFILTNSDIWYLYMNKMDYNDISWNMLTNTQSYLEEIERFFKLKTTGSKSQFYNINIIGLNTTTENKEIIENIIKDTVKKITPAYAELYRINWK